MIQYSPGSLQRELNSLVEYGLLLSEKMGNLRFFSLNQKCPFLKELKLYLSQHAGQHTGLGAASKSNEQPPAPLRNAPKPPRKPKKSRPVLEQKIQDIAPVDYSRKQDTEEEKIDMPIQSDTHRTTQVTIQSTPEPPRPSTPFSYIEPPVFSKPVLHKPFFEKPYLDPRLTQHPTQQIDQHFDITVNPPLSSPQNEPPTGSNSNSSSDSSTDIEIHIE